MVCSFFIGDPFLQNSPASCKRYWFPRLTLENTGDTPDGQNPAPVGMCDSPMNTQMNHQSGAEFCPSTHLRSYIQLSARRSAPCRMSPSSAPCGARRALWFVHVFVVVCFHSIAVLSFYPLFLGAHEILNRFHSCVFQQTHVATAHKGSPHVHAA